MSTPLFENGYRGLADSRWSGVKGSVAESVGVDAHSTPGLIKVHQKLKKDSGTTITELCKASIPVSDGSRLWFSSESGKVWREVSGTYSLVYTNTLPYSIESMKFKEAKGVSTAGTPEEYHVDFLRDVQFSADGKKMYVTGQISGANYGTVFQYTLTTAWDISTATYASKSFEPSTESRSLFFKPDGSKVFFAYDNGTIETFSLSTPWDISTATTDTKSFDYTSQFTVGGGGVTVTAVRFSSDGTKMILFGGFGTAKACEYTLSTAWDVTSATYVDSVSFTLSSTLTSGAFTSDGLVMFVSSDADKGTVLQYNLTTAWDISTATLFKTKTNLSENTGHGWGMTVGNSNTRLYFGDNGYTPDSILSYSIELADTSVANISAEEFEGYIYWATKNRLLRTPVTDINDFSEAEVGFGVFENGDDTYHPMTVQNTSLFIGDKTTIAQVDNNATFGYTNFNVPTTERIQSFGRIDIDIVVGTRYGRYARALRWDTVSDSWSSEDMVYEPGISAFIHDDNFLYAYAGNQGRLYFYNGEKLERAYRIRGSWSASHSATVHQYSVGYYNGLPVFGLSTVAGTPCKMGVYTLGAFSPSYPVALDLAYPIGNTYNTQEFGAIIVDGVDMWVATKTGVYKVDHSNKYEYAHFETRQLGTADRRGTFTKYLADYVSLPTSTGITFSYKAKYSDSFTVLTSMTDSIKEQVRAELSVPNVTSLQLRVDFTVSGNNAPEVEQFNIE